MANLKSTVSPLTQHEPQARDVTAEIDSVAAQGNRLREAGDLQAAATAFGRLAELVPHEWLAQYNAGAVFLEAGRLNDAADAFERANILQPSARGCTSRAHVLALAGNMSAAKDAFEAAVTLAPLDFDAHWGLFEVNQLLEDTAAALHHQRIALAQRSLTSVPARTQPARTTLLELCVAGTFQANVPLDFILDQNHTTVHKLYLGEHPIPELPPYDIVFNTIAESPHATSALGAAERFIGVQERPSINDPQLVQRTSRDSVAERFKNSQNVAVAQLMRVSKEEARTLHPAFPFLVRPLDSHAGNDLAKIDDDGSLNAYLDATSSALDFYLSEFIDYRNADGYFRKYRIVFVDGVPYPVHMAVSPRWMIHYYNAPMAENAWMREEEHAFMRAIDSVFDGPRAAGLREIAQSIALDYFGIDCSIAADGRVLLFEASTAMIVHMRDPVDLYPYKQKYVPRIIRALEELFDKRLQRGAR